MLTIIIIGIVCILFCIEVEIKGTNFKWKGITYSNNFIMKLKTMMKYILNK